MFLFPAPFKLDKVLENVLDLFQVIHVAIQGALFYYKKKQKNSALWLFV